MDYNIYLEEYLAENHFEDAEKSQVSLDKLDDILKK